MQLAQVLIRNTRLTPANTATVFRGRKHNWLQFQKRVARLATSLRNLGLSDGDRAAILALNSDRYLEILFAVPWAEGICVPLNTRWSLSEMLTTINDVGSGILFVDDRFLDSGKVLLMQAGSLRYLIHLGESVEPATTAGFEILDYEALVGAGDPELRPGKRENEDTILILYTSGTTSFPKGAMHSSANILHSAMYLMAGGLRPTSTDVYLHAAPMFHIADHSMNIISSMAGATHCFLESFDAEQAMQTITTCSVTMTLLVPAMIKMILDHPRFDEYDLKSLKELVYGGSPISKDLLSDLLIKLPYLQLRQGYAQTEMPAISFLDPEDHQPKHPDSHRLTSVGRPLLGVDVKIVDEHLSECRRGEVGQIATKGRNAMQGYWEKPGQTAATLVDGWILTGDVGYIDDDGYLYLLDRLKDMIISGGENIYSAEVEKVLDSHPDVQASAVIGVPSKKWGETVHAIVISTSDKLTEQQLTGYCRQHIAGYKCPKSIEFRHEPFPRSGTGKILKTELRARYVKPR